MCVVVVVVVCVFLWPVYKTELTGVLSMNFRDIFNSVILYDVKLKNSTKCKEECHAVVWFICFHFIFYVSDADSLLT